MKSRREKGVTLIELSMVLFIIGALYSIILVFQTLLEASKVRSQITQIDEYKYAYNTFDLKYHGLPGDFNKAALYGIGESGNGSRVIGDFLGHDEEGQFWVHLGNAEMIDFSPDGGALPLAKIGFGFVSVYYNDIEGEMYFHIGYPNDITDDSFTPLQAYNIDLKLDEGDPLKGFVVAASAPPLGGMPTQGEGGEQKEVCINLKGEYNYQNENRLCSLEIELEY